MRQIGIEIMKIFENHREDIFFVAVMIMILVVVIEMYEIDMFNSGGKKHVNVISIEPMSVNNDKKYKKKHKKNKDKKNETEGFTNISNLVKESTVIEGLSNNPYIAGTPAEKINQNALYGPKALKFKNERVQLQQTINQYIKPGKCRSSTLASPEELNEACLRITSDNSHYCNLADCCVEVNFSDKGKKRCVAGDNVGPIFSKLTETVGSGENQRKIDFIFNRDKDYYLHKGKCYGAACDNRFK